MEGVRRKERERVGSGDQPARIKAGRPVGDLGERGDTLSFLQQGEDFLCGKRLQVDGCLVDGPSRRFVATAATARFHAFCWKRQSGSTSVLCSYPPSLRGATATFALLDQAPERGDLVLLSGLALGRHLDVGGRGQRRGGAAGLSAALCPGGR